MTGLLTRLITFTFAWISVIEFIITGGVGPLHFTFFSAFFRTTGSKYCWRQKNGKIQNFIQKVGGNCVRNFEFVVNDFYAQFIEVANPYQKLIIDAVIPVYSFVVNCQQ